MMPNRLAAEFRAEIARRRLAVYRLAAVVGIHPVRLGRLLNEREELNDRVAERIRRALEKTTPADLEAGPR